MDVEETWKFRVSNRSLVLIIPLATLLLASVLWNLRQQRLIKQEHLRAMATQQRESARAKEEAKQAEARAKKKAEWAASDARLQQLYREIDNLSRLNEQILVRAPQERRTPTKKGDSAGAVGFP